MHWSSQIDTGRNYFSIASLKRIVDAMSYNKLNVLHWHISEQQSFPLVSERVPELASFGAYSNRFYNSTYTSTAFSKTAIFWFALQNLTPFCCWTKMEKSDYLNLVYFFCNNKNGLPYSCLADPNLVQVHSVYFRKDIRAEDDKKVII